MSPRTPNINIQLSVIINFSKLIKPPSPDQHLMINFAWGSRSFVSRINRGRIGIKNGKTGKPDEDDLYSGRCEGEVAIIKILDRSGG